MQDSRRGISPSRNEFLAAILGQRDPASTAAFVAEILVEYNFNPDEPRDERGRWTTGGSDADGAPGTLQTLGDSDVSYDDFLRAVRYGILPDATAAAYVGNEPTQGQNLNGSGDDVPAPPRAGPKGPATPAPYPGAVFPEMPGFQYPPTLSDEFKKGAKAHWDVELAGKVHAINKQLEDNKHAQDVVAIRLRHLYDDINGYAAQGDDWDSSKRIQGALSDYLRTLDRQAGLDRDARRLRYELRTTLEKWGKSHPGKP